MICDECKKKEIKSKVFKIGHVDPTVDSNSFYDSDGKQHIHNKEKLVTFYICSNGHSFKRTIFPFCWCGWKA